MNTNMILKTENNLAFVLTNTTPRSLLLYIYFTINSKSLVLKKIELNTLYICISKFIN